METVLLARYLIRQVLGKAVMKRYEIVHKVTGKRMPLPPKVACGFFGASESKKRIICLPVSKEVAEDPTAVANVYEVREYKRKKKMPGILVIRMGGLGDLVMLSSGLREMAHRREMVTIATLPQFVPFMSSMRVGKVITIQDIGRYTFEKVIDLRFAVEPKELGQMCKGTWADYTTKDRSDLFEELLGIYPARKRFEVPVLDNAAKKISRLLVEREKYVAINACMVASARSIPPKYIQPLCRNLTELGVGVVLFGSSYEWNRKLKDIRLPNVVNLIDQTSIEEMVALISLSDVVVTPDTGSLHIAAALKKKTVALFGNINPRTRCSYYPTVQSLYPVGEFSCTPCWDLHPCTGGSTGITKCMSQLTPDRITNAVKTIGGFE